MLLIASALATWVGLSITGVSVQLRPLTGLGLWVAASGALTFFQGRMSSAWIGRLIDWFEALALFCSISLLGCFASYALTVAGGSYADEYLAALDRALGFDWPTAYHGVERSPLVQTAGRIAYASIFVSPVAILSVLCARGFGEEARGFVFVYGLALWFTMAVFPFAPARGPLEYFHLQHASYAPATSLDSAAIGALRVGLSSNVDLGHLHGLVSFPSFHAASAVMFVWAARPVRWLFWPMAAVNAAMLWSTPVEGDHYLVDLIGGGLVAWVSIRLGSFLLRFALPQRGALQAREPGGFSRWPRLAPAWSGSSASHVPEGTSAIPVTEFLAA